MISLLLSYYISIISLFLLLFPYFPYFFPITVLYLRFFQYFFTVNMLNNLTVTINTRLKHSKQTNKNIANPIGTATLTTTLQSFAQRYERKTKNSYEFDPWLYAASMQNRPFQGESLAKGVLQNLRATRNLDMDLHPPLWIYPDCECWPIDSLWKATDKSRRDGHKTTWLHFFTLIGTTAQYLRQVGQLYQCICAIGIFGIWW